MMFHPERKKRGGQADRGAKRRFGIGAAGSASAAGKGPEADEENDADGVATVNWLKCLGYAVSGELEAESG